MHINRFKTLPNIFMSADDSGADGGGEIQEPQVETIEITSKGGKKVHIPKELNGVNLKEILDYQAASARYAGKSEAQKELDDLMKQIKEQENLSKDLESKVQQYEDEKLSAEERAQKKYEREQEKIQKQIEEITEDRETFKGLYRNERINNSLDAALMKVSKGEIYNLEQARKLFREDGKADLNDNHEVVLKLMVDGIEEELSAEDAATKWLEKAENAHHLKSNLRPGGGSNGKGGIPGLNTMTMAQIDKMTPEEINQNWDAVQKVIKQQGK